MLFQIVQTFFGTFLRSQSVNGSVENNFLVFGFQFPIISRLECVYFLLTLHDHRQSRRLNPTDGKNRLSTTKFFGK